MGILSAPKYRTFAYIMLVWIIGFLLAGSSQAQEATIMEADQVIRTYPFGDPSPIPILTEQPEIYPYFRFDGFSHEARRETWKVVTLENDYIKVYVLPEVGGKVYGAIEKSTGREFIYRNEVLKFRDIAMRGPWTSGGIEFNFGSIGHAPTTATPVDYEVRKNPDGSVSCFVGAPDLPSRTRWLVEIRLPADKAYFETRMQWFNASPLNQSNYHWLTSAQLARDDLEFFFPGTHYIGHGGEAHPWPTDENERRLSLYRNNDFGGSKSYHILGNYDNFYGGYWHDDDFGYGQWAEYQDYPGQKLWIWALSRQGGIWEDLLTDTSGQYIESQSGRFFNQAGLNSGMRSPFTQQYLAPQQVETGSSLWFPVKAIEGMVDASPFGILNVDVRDDEIWVGLNSLQVIDDQLRIHVGDSLIQASHVRLAPMEVHETTVSLPPESRGQHVAVELGDDKLFYTSNTSRNRLERPLWSDHVYDESTAEGQFRIAEEQAKYRSYEDALANYLSVLQKEPLHIEAAVRIAELYYKQGQYQQGVDYVQRALKISAYHPAANYYYGLLQQELGNTVDAREAFEWAARDPAYRTAGNIALARLSIRQNRWKEAAASAERALNSDSGNVAALQLLALAMRKQDRAEDAEAVLDSIEAADPLNHFVRFERYFQNPSSQRLEEIQRRIRHELPYQTYLERGIWYANMDLTSEAVEVLEAAPEQPVVAFWLAYLLRDDDLDRSRGALKRAEAQAVDFAFPYRRETRQALEWAGNRSASWKTGYYLGLVYWANGQKKKAWEEWQALEETPDYGPFYLSRGLLAQELETDDPLADFNRALEVSPDEWRAWHHRVEYALQKSSAGAVVEQAREAYERFPENYVVGMDYARVLLATSDYENGLEVLNQIRVLPYEGAGEGRRLWMRANLHRGLDLLAADRPAGALEYFQHANRWPEHLGVGRPYHPDTRMVDYLIAEALRRTGRAGPAEERLEGIAEYTQAHRPQLEVQDYFGMLAYQQLDMPEKADSLLSRWITERGGRSPITQWVQARLNGRTQQAARIAEGRRLRDGGEADPWEAQVRDSEFELVVEIAETLDGLQN